MKIKTSELTGVALDWAVAKADNASAYLGYRDGVGKGVFLNTGDCAQYQPSTNWAQGGPIIEREGIHLRSVRSEGHILNGTWLAKPANGNTGQIERWHKTWFGDKNRPAMWYGATPLEAAMRCYVASKLGNEVEVPDEIAN